MKVSQEERTTHTYEYGFASIVVHRPVLDDKERQKREVALQRAVAVYGKEAAKRQMSHSR